MSDASEPSAPEASSLVAALRVVQERWLLILGMVVLVTGALLAVSLSSTKQYEATTSIIIEPPQAANLVNAAAAQGVDPERDQATALLLVRSSTVADRAQKQLRSTRSASDLLGEVSADSEPDANLIHISATDPVPQEAARIANAFAVQFAAFRLEQARGQLDASIRDLRAQLQATPVADRTTRQGIGETLSQVRRLRATTTGDASVVDRAGVPGSPSSPNPKKDGAVGVVIGLVLGLAIAFLVDLLDRRVKSVDAFEELYGLPTLTSIPARTQDPSSNRDRQAALEPFRILRNGMALLRPDRDVRVVMVTSAVPGEGKSTVASGLARAVALSGQSVVLVEADLRRPTLHRQFALGDDVRGLTSSLVGGVPVESLLREVLPGLRSLSVLPSGPVPPNAAELLRSPEFSAVLQRMLAVADVVILDAPPLLPVADSQVLLDNPQVDGVIVVARAYLTTREECRRARAILQRHRRDSVGLVVNGLRELDSGYEYYGSPEAKPPKPSRRTPTA